MTNEIMTTKERIMEAANYTSSEFGLLGSYVNTDGEWCSTRTPDEFKVFLEKNGFTVIKCVSKPRITAMATTKEGYEIAWNGHCKKITVN